MAHAAASLTLHDARHRAHRAGARRVARPRSIFGPAYWAVALALVAVAIALTAFLAPVHPEMGLIQKMFYLHLSVAVNMLAACGVVFGAGIAFLWTRDLKWDALAHAGAQLAFLLGLGVILTGMIWAKRAWGSWWEWNSPLTLSLVLWLLYLGYLIVRRVIADAERRATICAVYGIVAFLDVPLVYLSVKLLPSSHESSLGLNAAGGATLAVWMVAVTMLTVGLIAGGYRLARLQASPPRTEARA